MNARICLMGVAVLALICLAGSAQATTLVSDNFEGYTDVATTWNDGLNHQPGGAWVISENIPEGVQVMANPATGAFTTPYGNQYMHMTRVQINNGEICEADVALSAGQQSMIANKDFHWEQKIYSGTVQGGGNIELSGYNGPGASYTNPLWNFDIFPNGVSYYDGANVNPLPTLSAAFLYNAWNSVAVDANLATQKWSATVNGVTVGNLPFQTAASTLQDLKINVWGFNIGGGVRTPPEIGVDNVLMSTTATPEPSTIAMILTGLVGLLAYAWRRRK
jgi:hypothetical protein